MIAEIEEKSPWMIFLIRLNYSVMVTVITCSKIEDTLYKFHLGVFLPYIYPLFCHNKEEYEENDNKETRYIYLYILCK
jgi:hypothetical protein